MLEKQSDTVQFEPVVGHVLFVWKCVCARTCAEIFWGSIHSASYERKSNTLYNLYTDRL